MLFISPCEGNQEEYPGSAIFVVELNGEFVSDPVLLATFPGGDYDPAWSPDGTSIIFTSHRTTGRPRIYKLDLTDNEVTLLSDKYSREKHGTWSPDGTEIAYVTAPNGVKEIWIMNSDGSESRQFSKTTDANNLFPDWSPIGDIILFTQYDFVGNVPGLTAGYYDESEYTEFDIKVGPFPMREGKYSPDGLWIVFEGWPEGVNHEIYFMAANGAGLTRLTVHPSFDFDPAWRPPIIEQTP